VLPVLAFAVIAVPLLVVGFLVLRRRAVVGEHPVTEDAHQRAELEQEFAAAEAYEEQWRAEDKDRFRREHLP
jgi:hypothetical protein